MLMSLNLRNHESIPNHSDFASEFPILCSQMQRRTFLKGSFAGLLALGFGNIADLPTYFLKSKISLEKLSIKDFEQLVGGRFHLLDQNQFLGTVQLDAIKDQSKANNRQNSPFCNCFSLSFQAARELIIPQGTYTFVHPKLGFLDLFIVPVEPTPNEQRYIAIINRI